MFCVDCSRCVAQPVEEFDERAGNKKPFSLAERSFGLSWRRIAGHGPSDASVKRHERRDASLASIRPDG